MTAATADGPLVTFALFAYNQEEYIREAIEGAFLQTYEPLEIIISDDCSNDQTYRIMQDMVAAYDGPHDVHLNKTDKNNGIAAHINDVAKMSTGQIIILAAGDDVSFPERTTLTTKFFFSIPNLFSAYTDFHIIGEAEKLASKTSAYRENPVNIMFGGGGLGKGATYAYRRECFFWPRMVPEEILSEDKILPFRAALLGEVYHIEKQLVAYRKHPDSLGERLKKDRTVALRRPEHVAVLKYELGQARQQGKISVSKLWLLRGILSYRRLTIMEIALRPVLLRKTIHVVQRFARSAMRRILRLASINRKVMYLE